MSIVPILFFGRSFPRYQKTSQTSSGDASTSIENECSRKGIEPTAGRATVAGEGRGKGRGGRFPPPPPRHPPPAGLPPPAPGPARSRRPEGEHRPRRSR